MLTFSFFCFIIFIKFKDMQFIKPPKEHSYIEDSSSYKILFNSVDRIVYSELSPLNEISNSSTVKKYVRETRQPKRRRRHLHNIYNGYSEWSDWSKCSAKCTTVRQRYCLRGPICGSNVVAESSHCFPGGRTRCPRPETGRGERSGWSSPNNVSDGSRRASAHLSCGVTAVGLPTASSSPRRLMKIMGGRESGKSRWPWHVAVMDGSREPICGGTLVAPGWVLTAAHCSGKKLYARLGEYDLSVDEGDEFDVGVERVVIHPRYNPNTIDNDMALLKLRDLDLEIYGGYHVRPACLPVSNFQRRKRKPKTCVVIGWGKVRPRDLYGSRVLREVRVPIVGQSTCRAAYRRYTITDNMLCAGYQAGRSDTCTGDSGGPLLCRMRGRWTVVGVTSFGDGCGRRGKYGIYASVTNQVQWIAAVITPSGYQLQ